MFDAGTKVSADAKLIVVAFELTIRIGVNNAPKPSVIWKNMFAYALDTFGDSVVGSMMRCVVEPLDGIVPVIGEVLALNTFTLNECDVPKLLSTESL